ncbi:hypothetical protein GHK65_28670 [Sinorhizobium meliloti]|uniref:NUMOD4 domain-containing protein n=1 Tax=Rhizobium meliloti TaxID=382 RepID=UPI001296613E|nr:NUMOD4 domain-containing protein [Sinorhizobium meliloti]MDW9568066.1 hypothetical protein [Sinorhizobium meliloti]MQV24199.1 hypothetical protein [Sinorhizobium meliloti]
MAITALAEEWRPVEGYPGYEVSDLGRVRSWRSNGKGGGFRASPRVLSPSKKRNGYLQVNLWRDGVRSTFTVHSLVAEAFIGRRPDGQECRHRDGDKANNRKGNLLWGTPSENTMDNVTLGVHPGFKIRGEAHYRATISETKAEQIKALTVEGVPPTVIADRLGISVHTVKSVKYGAGWANGVDRAYDDGHFSADARKEREQQRAANGWAVGKGGRPSISVATVLEIRKLAPTVPQARLCQRFGLTRQTVSKIVNRQTWKHI